MSLIRADYRAEVLGGLHALGVDVREFVLEVPEATLRARIDADRVDTAARQWRQDRAAQALATFAGAVVADSGPRAVPVRLNAVRADQRDGR